MNRIEISRRYYRRGKTIAAYTLFTLMVLSVMAHAQTNGIPADDGCNDARFKIMDGDLEAAEEMVKSDKKYEKCGVILTQYYYEAGRMKEAARVAAWCEERRDKRWREFYHDSVYYSLLIKKPGDEVDAKEFSGLIKYSVKKARDVIEKKKTECSPALKSFLKNPWENEYTKIDRFWIETFKMDYDKFDRVVFCANIFKSRFDETRREDFIDAVYLAFKNVHGLEIHFDGETYTYDVESRIKTYEHYKNYFSLASSAKPVEDYIEKTKIYKKAFEEYLEAVRFNTVKDEYITDSEGAGSAKDKYTLMAEMDEYFQKGENEPPPMERIARWENILAMLEPDVSLPEDYQTPLALLMAYSDAKKKVEIKEFHCPDPYEALLGKDEWETEFAGKEVLTKAIQEPVRGEMEKKTRNKMKAVSDALKNPAATDHPVGELDEADRLLRCIQDTYGLYVDRGELDKTKKDLDNLRAYYLNREIKNRREANTALEKLPGDIIKAWGLEHLLDCREKVERIESVLEDDAREPSRFQRYKTAGVMITDPYDREECMADIASGYPDLFNRLKADFFTEVMKEAFSLLKTARLEDGKTVLREILDDTVFSYKNKGTIDKVGEIDNIHKYAQEKYNLLDGVIKGKSYTNLGKYMDKRPFRFLVMGPEYHFFKGEEEIVKRLLEHPGLLEMARIDWGKEIQNQCRRKDMAEIRSAWEKVNGKKPLTEPGKSPEIRIDQTSLGPSQINSLKETCATTLFDLSVGFLAEHEFRSAEDGFLFYAREMDPGDDQKERAENLRLTAHYLSLGEDAGESDLEKLGEIVKKLGPEDREPLKGLVQLKKESVSEDDFRGLRSKGETLLNEFKYRQAFDFFKSTDAPLDENQSIIWEKRASLAEALLNLEKEVRESGAKDGKDPEVHARIIELFKTGILGEDSGYEESIPFWNNADANRRDIQKAHIIHMRYVFWLHFAERRLLQKRKTDAIENYRLGSKFAQTEEEKEFLNQKLEIAEGKAPPPPPTSTTAPEPDVFRDIRHLTDMALDGKVTEQLVDEVVSKARAVGDSMKPGNERIEFTDQVCEKIYVAGKALKRTNEGLAARLFLKIRSSDFFEIGPKELPNVTRLKKFIEEEL